MPYNPSAPFVRSGFLVSYRFRSAMKIPQNVLHYIWHTSRVYVIYIKSLSRYFQLTQNWTNKAKWRSIEASNNVNKHTGHGLLAVDSPPRINFALAKFNSTDGGTWQFIHSAAVLMALFQTRRVSLASSNNESCCELATGAKRKRVANQVDPLVALLHRIEVDNRQSRATMTTHNTCGRTGEARVVRRELFGTNCLNGPCWRHCRNSTSAVLDQVEGWKHKNVSREQQIRWHEECRSRVGSVKTLSISFSNLSCTQLGKWDGVMCCRQRSA